MIINRALIKEGYSKFSLTILEYCEILGGFNGKRSGSEKYYFSGDRDRDRDRDRDF